MLLERQSIVTTTSTCFENEHKYFTVPYQKLLPFQALKYSDTKINSTPYLAFLRQPGPPFLYLKVLKVFLFALAELGKTRGQLL